MRNGSMFGGTKRVAIEEMSMTSRGGRRQGPESYPFGELTPSRVEDGSVVGPSFFIPDSENPKRMIAAGRKRHKRSGKIFLTRQMSGPDEEGRTVPGVRVWLAPGDFGG